MKTNKKVGTETGQFPKVAGFFHLENYARYGSRLADIKKALKHGNVVIALMYLPDFKVAHYSIVKKISQTHIYFCDPWFGRHHSLHQKMFIKNWHDSTPRITKTRWFFALKDGVNIEK